LGTRPTGNGAKLKHRSGTEGRRKAEQRLAQGQKAGSEGRRRRIKLKQEKRIRAKREQRPERR
jgi:hypothetical protein